MRFFLLLIVFCFFAALSIQLAQPLKTSPQPAQAEIAAPRKAPEQAEKAFQPLPAARTLEAPRQKLESAPLITKQTAQNLGSETPCTDLLAEGIATVQLAGPMAGISGEAFCGDEAPARMTAIKLRDGSMVQLSTAVLSKCEMALEFARWVRDDLSAAVKLGGGSLRRINIAASYSCRPRNNIKGQRLSEHGLANAVDVSAIGLADGRTFTIFSPQAPAILLATMRATACARFTTVLGPGSDKAHEDHIHFDLARRRGGYKLCQWNMPDWPEP